MARQARVISPLGLYYIELKGEKLFYNPKDRDEFIKTARECFSDGKIYGTFLSDTLIKMVVKAGENGISAAMKSLSIRYARFINKSAGTTGKIFSGRFKSEPLYSEADAVKLANALPDGPAKPAVPAAQKKTATRGENKTLKSGETKKSEKPVKSAKAEKPPKKEETAERVPEKPKKKNLPPWLL